MNFGMCFVVPGVSNISSHVANFFNDNSENRREVDEHVIAAVPLDLHRYHGIGNAVGDTLSNRNLGNLAQKNNGCH
jgi:hypothetical protein